MLDYVNSLIESKLNEIESRLPLNISLTKKDNTFQEMLNSLMEEKPISTYDADYKKPLNSTNLLQNFNIKNDGKNNSASINDIKNYILEASKKYGVSPNLIDSVIKAESDYEQYTVSKTGAMGLMQLMPSTAAYLGIDNPFDAKKNIDGGTKLLSELISKYNNVKLALAAYNAGEAAVDKYNGIPPYNETINYVNKILKDLEK